MGQYYKPISIDKMQFVNSHDYSNGLKLMEHSWIGNDFVAVVERLIAKGGKWFGDRIVWAGDYADTEPDHDEGENLYHLVGENKIKPNPVKNNGNPEFRFIVNMDKKVFVDLKKVPMSDSYTDENGKVWPYHIHPLPLLTCEGNGRGGGDFCGNEKNLVGVWARDRITAQNELPEDRYTELIFNLRER